MPSLRGEKSGQSRELRTSDLYEERDQGFFAHLAAPVAVDRGVKRRAFGQGVVRQERIARLENARTAVLQTDFHLPAQDVEPLWRTCAMPLATKPHWALPQLVSRRRLNRREHGLRVAFGERDGFVAKFRAPVGIGE